MVESPVGYFARFDRLRQCASGLLLMAAVAELAMPQERGKFAKALLELYAITDE